jgi:hypothetical protein
MEVTIFVATDTPQISQTYSFSAAQLPCSLISLEPVTPTAINCSSALAIDSSSCVVVSSLSVPAFGFTIDASQNCQYATIQRLQNLQWTNVSSSATAIDIGLNQYRLVYSSISNPPQIEVLTSVEVTLGLSSFHDASFLIVSSFGRRGTWQCHL